MQDIEIREIEADDWQSFKDFRLEALRESPLAFAFDYEEEVEFSKENWQNKIRNTFYLATFLNGKLIACIGANIYKGSRMKHIAEIVGVYIIKEYRGGKIAKELFDKMLFTLKEQHIEKLKLWVNAEQKNALKFYKKCGFKLCAKALKEIKIDGRYYDEYYMEMMI